jgi:hypothetical protein
MAASFRPVQSHTTSRRYSDFLSSPLAKLRTRHILYAFANLKADTGEVVLSDDWADKDIHYPGKKEQVGKEAAELRGPQATHGMTLEIISMVHSLRYAIRAD